jgi:hypothetical protein
MPAELTKILGDQLGPILTAPHQGLVEWNINLLIVNTYIPNHGMSKAMEVNGDGIFMSMACGSAICSYGIEPLPCLGAITAGFS